MTAYDLSFQSKRRGRWLTTNNNTHETYYVYEHTRTGPYLGIYRPVETKKKKRPTKDKIKITIYFRTNRLKI